MRNLSDVGASGSGAWIAVQRAVEEYGKGGVAVSSSFQTQSMPLLHLVGRRQPRLDVIFVDTGYHFPETLAFRDAVVARFGLRLRVVRPDVQGFGDAAEAPYRTNPDLCCDVHKVQPVRAVMKEYRAWISGIRRDQSAVRADAQPVEQGHDGLLRLHPMLDWTQADIEAYIAAHDLPRHPLDALGYTSIGCKPCTRPPVLGGDWRSGRWQGTGKTECGLHTRLRNRKTDDGQ